MKNLILLMKISFIHFSLTDSHWLWSSIYLIWKLFAGTIIRLLFLCESKRPAIDVYSIFDVKLIIGGQVLCEVLVNIMISLLIWGKLKKVFKPLFEIGLWRYVLLCHHFIPVNLCKERVLFDLERTIPCTQSLFRVLI
jgi:hypothetical protein